MEINDLGFNQDFSYIIMSSSAGYRIFNCEPFGEFYALGSDKANPKPTAFLRILFSTSLAVIVPKGPSETRVLHVHNMKQNQKICELTFPLDIVDLMLNRKRLVVFLEVGQIYLYDLSTIRLVKILDINSFVQADGTKVPVQAALSTDDNSLLVIPILMINALTDLLETASGGCGENFSHGESPVLRPTDSTVINSISQFIEFTRKNTDTRLLKADVITLEDIQNDSQGWILVYDAIHLRPQLVYKAHDAGIARIAISHDGNSIATASQKGTIVRVCHVESDSTSDFAKLKISRVVNLRRGHNHATIYALQFNHNLSILGCSSESNTVHLFTVREKDELTEASLRLDDNDYSSEEDSRSGKSSLEDLNENLAKLLILKQPDSATANKDSSLSYFSTFKSSKKILNNLYTKSLIKKLPYRHYLDTLIWEKPQRSFAFVKLPEYVPSNKHHKNVEVGFTRLGLLMLASYNTGNFYLYRLPKGNTEEREECGLMLQNSLVG
ncbi:hypothetical protein METBISCDRAFT_14403 [Metschnikowia bicuspidata]|uniref:WD40 repeat-like protein n=1 Tax=Metschnikowia bicuspidata TaxID=27322 RepID=A0A4P9ZFM3_9ASCO|nr:hypothetical protein METBISCDRAFT_14403 [Metschnikowia bicuspidata]